MNKMKSQYFCTSSMNWILGPGIGNLEYFFASETKETAKNGSFLNGISSSHACFSVSFFVLGSSKDVVRKGKKWGSGKRNLGVWVASLEFRAESVSLGRVYFLRGNLLSFCGWKKKTQTTAHVENVAKSLGLFGSVWRRLGYHVFYHHLFSLLLDKLSLHFWLGFWINLMKKKIEYLDLSNLWPPIQFLLIFCLFNSIKIMNKKMNSFLK